MLSFTSNGGGGGTATGGFRKQLVVMDEVDGMGGSDRGGIQELILLIKKSRVPIIAICNDRQHQKIRYCKYVLWCCVLFEVVVDCAHWLTNVRG